MIKKDYMKPTLKVVKLQHSQHILVGSYTDIRTRNSSDDDDDDNPGYDGSGSGDIWDDAN
jgi:hypothetical protein